MTISVPVASTQSRLDIEDIRDNLVLFKDGSCCLILQSTAINFSLLSESEQDATIYSYAALLNSLTFSVQIVIKSQKKDISSYLSLLNAQKQTIKNPLLKIQLEKYYQFIQKIVQENEVLDKKFYLVIPFSSLELGISSTLGSAFKKKSASLPFSIDSIIQKAKNSLFPKRDHLISQLTRLGLKARQLTTPELIKLFYQAYNPDSGFVDFPDNAGYGAPLVTAAINLTPPPPEARKEGAHETQSPA
ncbi:MAG: hypothetical protein UV54_C0049G0006 [Candidatus Beckwithbacteria bacterium GW2011_GWA2_43_10]|uniref:Uncharacterized protein n=1 Tax=Candidatus Beckwithbacteria bacterium GW2011_GWA2_43_10 TaxID=1618369 RepID=A0A0G1BZT3_9BACT|nr:MAG: hypothetical protein UV54_C0049G0006 [Candidatus Beckwithbacteria bacterium GW2011_GWA2_43_10]